MKAHAVEVRPGPVEGALRAPPSKSETHRAFLLAAQSDVPCRIRSPLRSDDTLATLGGLRDFGARLHLQDDDVQFLPAPLRPPRQAIDCANSGTTLRMLAAFASRFGQDVTLTGDDSLRRRPNGPLLDALTRLGASCSSADGKAPLTVRGPLRAGSVTLPAGASSQFASALVLALATTPGGSTVEMQPPVASAPYLGVTLEVAGQFGLHVEVGDHPGMLRVRGGEVPRAERFSPGGDWSAAAFPLVAAAITGGRVTVAGLRGDSRQGDRALVDLLQSFGARAKAGPDNATCDGGDLQSPGTVDVSATPDLFPALAVLAACSRGTTTFTGGAALRHKESDRIAAMAQGLARMGVGVRELPDGLEVTGGRPRGAIVASHADHRIHMAFVVAGLAATGITTIDDPACVSASYPRFHDALQALGAGMLVLQGNRAQVAG